MSIGENVGENVGEHTGSSGSAYRGVTPIITSIRGVEGSNELTVYFNTGVKKSDFAFAFSDGFELLINGVNYSVGDSDVTNAGNGVLIFYIVGSFSTNDSLSLTYESIFQTISSVLGNIQLADQTITTTAKSISGLIIRDFELGTVGALAVGDGIGFDNASVPSQNYYSNEQNQTPGGSKSIKTTILQGTSGSGFGGAFLHNNALVQGDEVWFRASMYYPSTWKFNTVGEGLKTFRMRTYSGGGVSEGYIDVYTKIGGGGYEAHSEVGGSTFNQINNPNDTPNSSGFIRNDVGSAINLGAWNTLEMHIKFSSGNGVYRIWQDGILVWEDLVTFTLKSSSSNSPLIKMYTYWNNRDPITKQQLGAEQTQSCYIDDVVIATSTPPNLDAQGNPFIGLP